MIAVGLVIEVVAAALVVAALLLGAPYALLWTSVVLVLAGLLTTMIGVRGARPPRRGWAPSRPEGGASS